MEISLVFPNQLYDDHPAIQPGRPVVMVEDPLFFLQFSFHKKKLLLHRASMKRYQQKLESRSIKVFYIDAKKAEACTESLIAWLKSQGFTRIILCDPTDYLLSRRLHRYSTRSGIEIITLESPNFLTSVAEIQAYFGSGRRFLMADFYKFQRKRLQVMVDGNTPVGGKWSFDEDNRKKLPKGLPVPAFKVYNDHPILMEAVQYIEQEFPSNPGSIGEFEFPIDHEGALCVLQDFLHQRFVLFGIYQDAIVNSGRFLFHSVLSSSLNIGLLSPWEVVKAVLEFAGKNQIPLNSLEGFIRQLIGWREYIRAVYILKGVQERTTNYFGFNRPVTAGFWNATTGIAPVDSVISRLLQSGYSHHIERLMIIGNFMLLCEFDPDEVYKWFMSLYIDAYDWVMVPNVYGMSQFADGGIMSTKPYISSSNYVLKMSDFKKGAWSVTWDALFWRFMMVHSSVFEKNQRLSFLLQTFRSMDANKRDAHLQHAEDYLKSLDGHTELRFF